VHGRGDLVATKEARKMRILLCHNFYQQQGGEDLSFAAEGRLLESHGHEVVQYTKHNDAIDEMSTWDVVRRTVWNHETYNDLRALIRRTRPAVMHCTNIFPLISSSAYDAARAEGIPIVQSLRNFRWFCPAAFAFREGRVCEDCLGRRIAWPGIRHKCYRNSRAATATVSLMAAANRLRNRWRRSADLYFTPSKFARSKLIQAGCPADRIMVKPNFIDPDPGPGAGKGNYALFVGRLSPEKGIDVLVEAWSRLDHALPLWVVGDGPLRESLQRAAASNPAIRWLGAQSPQQVLALMGNARCVVVPSIWYETFGRTIIESYARGTPVIASRLGAMAELVDDGQTGWHFTPGDAADLAATVQHVSRESASLVATRARARKQFLDKYTAQTNLVSLLAIYQKALELKGSGFTPDIIATPIPKGSENDDGYAENYAVDPTHHSLA
jgi:glycosyltransferase involved in cell wall biosynthesis